MAIRDTLRSEAALGFAAGAIGRYLAFCLATTRWRVDIDPDARRALAAGGAIIAFWHERLPLMPMLWRRRPPEVVAGRDAYVLISRHRDGRLIARIVSRFGLRAVEGSSSRDRHGRIKDRGGAAALVRLAELVEAGEFVAITPDGPRGPRRHPASGVARLASTTGAPVLPCAASATPRIVLPTWDRLHLPLPFAHGRVVVGAPLRVGPLDATPPGGPADHAPRADPPGQAPPAAPQPVAAALGAVARARDRAAARADGDGAAAAAALAAWRGAATALAPALRLLLRRRLAAGKERAGRVAERRGLAAGPRPPGPLVWIHAASLGELSAVLPVAAALLADARPDWGPAPSLLLTTATVSAATLAERWIAAGGRAGTVRHRMVPFDVPRWVRRFLDGWRPDVAVFVESELWPNTLRLCRARHVRLMLLNARLSDRSAARWAAAPRVARAVLGAFDVVWARSDEDAARLARVGAPPSRVADLKAAAPPLPADAERVASLASRLAGRPRWLLASTHPGEEEIGARVHARLSARHPGLLTIVAPRHPVRGAAIAAAAGGAPRRALGDDPPAAAGLWIADTLGELGLLYRLCPVVFLGRSLGGDGGGQNPWEPARLGCAVVSGPGTRNFRDPVRRLEAAGALRLVNDEEALVAAVDAFLSDPALAEAAGRAGQAAAAEAATSVVGDAARLIDGLARPSVHPA